jgi:hydrogenase nickel incorporation protein HypA/HybF
MHEAALLRDLVGRIEAIARREGASRVTRVRVRLGALAHLTPEHFLEHFRDGTAGTVADGAAVEVELSSDHEAPEARSVLLRSVEVEAR